MKLCKIEVRDYKCLRKINLELDNFQILIGPNASGKSTLLDVLAFAKDLVSINVEQAVVARASSLMDLTWRRKSQSIEFALEYEIPKEISEKTNSKKCRYEVKIGVDSDEGIILERENFWLIRDSETGKKDVDSIVFPPRKHTPKHWRKVIIRNPDGTVNFYSETTRWSAPFRIDPKESALSNLPEDKNLFPSAVWLKKILKRGIHRLILISHNMRKPCRPDLPKNTFLEDGSNLPLLVKCLKEEFPERYEMWLGHLRLVFPSLHDITVKQREIDNFLYILNIFRDTNNSETFSLPSWLLSDGSLRLILLTMIAYLPSIGRVYLIEEPENGIHPRAVELVYQSLSSVYDGQVFVTTHSPLFLKLAEPKNLLCFSLNQSGETEIVRGDRHPYLADRDREFPLGDLFASGVLG